MTNKQTFWRTFAITVAMLLTMPATLWADSNLPSAVLSHGDVNGDGKASVADITTLIDHLLGNN
jgi:hypothetical protein